MDSQTACQIKGKTKDAFLWLSRGESDTWEKSQIRFLNQALGSRTPHSLMHKDPKLQDGIKPCWVLAPTYHHSAYIWFLLLSSDGHCCCSHTLLCSLWANTRSLPSHDLQEMPLLPAFLYVHPAYLSRSTVRSLSPLPKTLLIPGWKGLTPLQGLQSTFPRALNPLLPASQ